ncbi:MAG: hypothetical protein KatS3mg063_2692 [Tepidiforma sp.]|nr:MAG: hypothetical protein KatS3mg063_2665 [Tepidiforma sp.]GIW16839.1 MAG: hypothetical protein KatS3mg063_2692 [Tepidiforma sp.]
MTLTDADLIGVDLMQAALVVREELRALLCQWGASAEETP